MKNTLSKNDATQINKIGGLYADLHTLMGDAHASVNDKMHAFIQTTAGGAFETLKIWKKKKQH